MAAGTLGTAFVDVRPDMAGFGRDLSRGFGKGGVGKLAADSGRRAGSGFTAGFGKVVGAIGGLFAAKKAFDFIGDSLAEARESAEVARVSEQIVKSTGGVANVTAGHLGDLAQRLSGVIGVDDELIQSNANVLLTFKNVRNEVGQGNNVFDQAVGLGHDLASVMKTDARGAMLQLGKALGDPVKGITALKRAGVDFTDQQKEQIKTLVASGDRLGAQKIILKELQDQVGGAAAAAADPSKKLGVIFGNLKESFGTLLLPLVNRFATFMGETVAPNIAKVVPLLKGLADAAVFVFKVGFGGASVKGIGGWLGVVAKIGAAVRGLVDFFKGDVASAGVQLGKLFGIDEDDPRVGGFIKALTRIREVFVEVIAFVRRNWKPILAIAAGALLLFMAPIATVIAGLIALYVRFEGVRNVVAAVVEFVKRNWPAVRDTIVGILTSVREFIAAFVAVVLALWQRFGDVIVRFVREGFSNVLQQIRGVLSIIRGVIQVFTALLRGDWGKAWEGIKNIVAGVWNVIQGLVRQAMNIIRTVLVAGLRVVGDVFHAVFGGMLNKAGEVVSGIVGFFTSLPDRIRAAIGRIGAAALDVGKAIIKKLAEGVSNIVRSAADFGSAVADAVKRVLNGIIRTLNDLFDFKLKGPGPLPDLHVNLPDIPQFARGAVITRPTLALLGETQRARPEIATPERLLRQIMREEQPTAPMVNNFYGIPDGRSAVSELTWAMRTRGR